MTERKKDPNGEEAGTDLVWIDQVRSAANLPAKLWSDEKIRTVYRTLAPPGATVADVGMFLTIANHYDLDPYLKEIWLAKDDTGKIMVLTGRDAILKQARRAPTYRGHKSGLVHEKDEFRLEVLEGGAVQINHVISFPRGELLGAYSVVYLEGQPPAWVVREIADYAHLFGKKNWKNYKPDMFLTRVVTAAHRLAVSLTGLYTPEDFIGGELRPDDDVEEPTAGLEAMHERLEQLRQEKGRDVSAAKDPEPDYEIVEADGSVTQVMDGRTVPAPRKPAPRKRKPSPHPADLEEKIQEVENAPDPIAGAAAQVKQAQRAKRGAAPEPKVDDASDDRGSVDPGHSVPAPGARAHEPGPADDAETEAGEAPSVDRGSRTGKTKPELSRKYFAKLAELTEWGDGERKMWQEQRVGKASCSTWNADDYELAILLLDRGELEYEPPLVDHGDPEGMPV